MSYKSSIWRIGWGWSGIAENEERNSEGSAIYQEDKIWSIFLWILVFENRESYEMSIVCSSLTPSVSEFFLRDTDQSVGQSVQYFLLEPLIDFFWFFHEVTLLGDRRTDTA